MSILGAIKGTFIRPKESVEVSEYIESDTEVSPDELTAAEYRKLSTEYGRDLRKLERLREKGAKVNNLAGIEICKQQPSYKAQLECYKDIIGDIRKKSIESPKEKKKKNGMRKAKKAAKELYREAAKAVPKKAQIKLMGKGKASPGIVGTPKYNIFGKNGFAGGKKVDILGRNGKIAGVSKTYSILGNGKKKRFARSII
jgi:hypothetical protein